ncbi:MAG: DnaJ domain-containing protein [Candidatus Sericytochromatia bacterium]
METLDDDDLWRVDLFEVLGIAQDTEKDDVRNAYKSLAKKFHPDRYPANSKEQEEAKERFSMINRAYEVLSNDMKRAQYLDTRRLLAEHLVNTQKAEEAAAAATAAKAAAATAAETPAVKIESNVAKTSAEEYKKKQAEDSYKEGQRLFSRNQLDEAITAYQQAIAAMPSVAKYHSALGQAYTSKGWKGMAQSALKQALVLDPKDGTAKRLFEPEKPSKKGLFDGLKGLFKK